MRFTPTMLSLALLCAALAAQQGPNPPTTDPGGEGPQPGDRSLLFTVRAPGHHATLSGSSGTRLGQLNRNAVATITPHPGASSETYLNRDAFGVMHGDKNGDAVYPQGHIGGGIDALLLCPGVSEPRFEDLYFSVRQPILLGGTTAVMTSGDVGHPTLGGGYEFFLREDQIKSAFGIDLSVSINVDAVARTADGDVLLSLEDDVAVFSGTVMARDGDLLMIDAASLFYDGCRVSDVLAGSGRIVCSELQFDGMVSNANVTDASAVTLHAIEDLDGLAIDPRGKTWLAQGESGSFLLPNLLFVGQSLQGASVLSTAGGGSIAELNGHRLGKESPSPNDGVEMGVQRGSHALVLALNALEVLDSHQPLRVLVDVDPDVASATVPLAVHCGGADPFGAMWLQPSAGISTVNGSVPGVPVHMRGFGVLFTSPPGFGVPAAPLGPVPCDAAGFAALPPTATPAAVGLWVNLQAATLKGGVPVLGGPATVQF